ncbi:MAG: arginine--tRNA ligase [Eubacteriales bacterium]|nr:arginine--tRNA ligase [Eubacteriales bacterium]
MSKIIKQTQALLKSCITDAVNKAIESGALPQSEIPEFIIEQPADRKNGDFSSNIAMAGARAFHQAPRAIAQAICDNISLDGSLIEKYEIAGPGFINFYMADDYYSEILKDVVESGDSYGKSDYGKGKRVLVEFVSANPTGPMHIGNARGGAIGDCLASVLDAAGYDVQREFYINDAGNQIEKFATSLEVRYLQLCGKDIEMPEDAYHGEDITVHAKNFFEINGDKYADSSSDERRKALVDYALPLNIQGLEDDLKKYRIVYDKWFRESTLHNDGSVKWVIDTLKEKGATYEQEGALWFKASEFGNDKDIVLVRANGIPTYIVPDIAYHYNKLVTRGYDIAIDVLGADHHGYIPRMRAALSALGLDASRLNPVIMQMVRLVRNGETVKLSKRSGKAITLNTLLEEVPIDAARFLFNLREPNSHCDFDLELAVTKSSENPVYYVQYAHARICSILKKAKEQGIEACDVSQSALNRLNTSEERELISFLAGLTDEIITSAKAYDPARITHYVIELATLFHKFYNAHRVVSEDEELTQARLYLCTAVKNTIKNILVMLKVDVPESM